MKIIFVFSFFVTVSLACSDLPRYSACDMKAYQNCACAAGLSCIATREIIMAGQITVVKQCMPENEVVVVERLTEDDLNEILNPGSVSPDINARFYPGKKCTTAAECFWPNTCCMFNKRCGLKLPKYFTCYLQSLHKCGCMDGLVCKTTTHVTLPIVKVPFPIRQCVPENEA